MSRDGSGREPFVTTTVYVTVLPEDALSVCHGDTHVFDRRPGNCRCGSEFWDRLDGERDLRAVE